MRRTLILITCLMLFTLSAMTIAQESTQPIIITDATGATVTIESLDRIVSANGDVTEILFALDQYASEAHPGYHNLVGVDTSSTYPPEALDQIEAIGFGRRLALEPIVAVNPTVVFCTQICGPVDVLDQLRALNIPVVLIPDTEDGGLSLPAQKIEMVAAALGIPEIGARVIADVEREINWVKIATANVETQPAVLHLYIRTQGLQLAGGAGTPSQFLIEGAGGIDAGTGAGVNQYQQISPEILLTAYPDYLLLTTGSVESAGGMDKVLEIQGLAELPAVQNDHIILMDTLYMLGASTRTGQAMMELAHLIHPEMTWELAPTYPYTFSDATETEITLDAPEAVLVTNETLLATVQNLGFHATLYSENPADGSLIIASEADATWAAAREQGFNVIVLPDDANLDQIAAALNVPGRGLALTAFLNQ